MKSFLAFLCLFVSEVATGVAGINLNAHMPLRREVAASEIDANGNLLSQTSTAQEPENEYGNPKCKCIGVSFGSGSLDALIGGTNYSYPADLGTSCKAWDDGNYPDCDGEGSDAWCFDAWCYVDPCSCDIETLPKVSGYFADGAHKGMSLYYSYATCGSVDLYTSAETNKAACVNMENEKDCNEFKTGQNDCLWDATRNQCGGKEIVSKCQAVPPPDEAVAGQAGCPCIGLSGLNGYVYATIGDELVPQTPDIGSSCVAWDREGTPSCKEEGAGSWCEDKWCYVDPCNCDLTVTPKTTSYFPFPNTTYRGYSVYYSYKTCGAEDEWTATEHTTACVNKVTKTECTKTEWTDEVLKCGWVPDESVEAGGKCLGKELIEQCSADACDSGSCTIYGDPHITRVDGMWTSLLRDVERAHQRPGDYWLVKSKALSIQARFGRNGPMMTHLAIGGDLLKGHVLTLGGADEKGGVLLDKEDLAASLHSNGHVLLGEGLGSITHSEHTAKVQRSKEAFSGPGLEVTLPQGVRLTVNRMAHTLNAAMDFCKDVVGHVGGYCGEAEPNLGNMLASESMYEVSPAETLFSNLRAISAM